MKEVGKTHLETALDELVLNLSGQTVQYDISILEFL